MAKIDLDPDVFFLHFRYAEVPNSVVLDFMPVDSFHAVALVLVCLGLPRVCFLYLGDVVNGGLHAS